ncbi:hypothetical protein [Actinomadura oligospora]|uniref:hypothetical protein n=1 Tax=Actinomadura oligospora TaxID=111804 RepID=UPI0012FBC59B|nr:hypothetical protein [Actinomadura oligospora]
MSRRLLVLPVLLALALLGSGACGSKAHHATGTSGPAMPSASGTGGASPGTCPSEATKKFAKTRFAGDAGLAFGAFHRWIYKPWKAGTFKSGAQDRKKAIVKGAAAGAFALNRLNAARKLVDADPTLCTKLKQPLESLKNNLSGLTDKLKSGDADPSQIGSAGGAIESFRQQASQNGATIKDKTPPNV